MFAQFEIYHPSEFSKGHLFVFEYYIQNYIHYASTKTDISNFPKSSEWQFTIITISIIKIDIGSPRGISS